MVARAPIPTTTMAPSRTVRRRACSRRTSLGVSLRTNLRAAARRLLPAEHCGERWIERLRLPLAWRRVAAARRFARANAHQRFGLRDRAAHAVEYRHGNSIFDASRRPRHDGAEHDDAFRAVLLDDVAGVGDDLDRKSTRLNSSHIPL